MKKLLRLENLTFICALLGLVCGLFFPELAKHLSIFGELFILLLKMVIIPLVFVSVFLAIANQSSIKDLSRLGWLTAVYFISSSALACITGFIAGEFLPETASAGLRYENYEAAKMNSLSVKELVLSFFSANPFRSLSEGNIIQIVVLAMFIGLATLRISREKQQSLVRFFDALNDVVMVIISWILIVAPIGVFSLVAAVVAATDRSAFEGLLWFFLATAIALFIHVFVTYGALGFFFGRFHPYRFLFTIKKAILVALATASSNATLPVSTRVMIEKEKVRPQTANFVLPLGATLNMDGSSIYQTLLVIFMAGLVGIDINFTQQIYIFFLILISSWGTAGVPGGGIMMIGAVFQNVGIPLEYLGLYLLIDRFWDPFVTMVNVVGDLFGTKIIDRYIVSKEQHAST
jgi:proton glutamate symport protein